MLPSPGESVLALTKCTWLWIAPQTLNNGNGEIYSLGLLSSLLMNYPEGVPIWLPQNDAFKADPSVYNKHVWPTLVNPCSPSSGTGSCGPSREDYSNPISSSFRRIPYVSSLGHASTNGGDFLTHLPLYRPPICHNFWILIRTGMYSLLRQTYSWLVPWPQADLAFTSPLWLLDNMLLNLSQVGSFHSWPFLGLYLKYLRILPQVYSVSLLLSWENLLGKIPSQVWSSDVCNH